MTKRMSLSTWTWALAIWCLGASDLGAQHALAQTRWCGPKLTYQQPAAGQADVLTPLVAINRAFNRGIFNSAQETEYVAGSPAGTEWAFGGAANYASLTFQPWGTAVGEVPPDMLGRDMTLHLIQENIYLDVQFTAWAQGPSTGSRFTYVRSTPGSCTAPAAVPALPSSASWAVLAGLLVIGGVATRSRRVRALSRTP